MQASAAFESFRNFKGGNTQVNTFITEEVKTASLFLHFNKIAELLEFPKEGKRGLLLNACGWLTNTTKERLNGLSGINVVQKRGNWFLNGDHWNGQLIALSWNFNTNTWEKAE